MTSKLPHAVVLDGHTTNPGDNPWAPLEALTQLTVYDRTPVGEIAARAADAEIVLTNKTPLSAETLAALPRLRLIAVLATGYNIIDTAAAKARGIVVVNVPTYSTESVAQHTFALLLELCQWSGEHSRRVHAGEWQRCPDFSFWVQPLGELSGKVLGIAGYGRIGRRVATIAAAFGMKVQFFSRHKQKEGAEGGGFVDWAEWLATSDILSLHCALTAENQGMMNAEAFAQMKRGAFLINTSRGPLVDEAALREALESGQVGGAGLDVLSQEPPCENPLIGAPRCIITPHIGWATLPARHRLMATTCENVSAFLRGHPQNVVG